MKNLRYLTPVLLFTFVCALTVTSCSKPADDLIMKAEDALKAAAEAGAETDSPNLYGKAYKQLQDAKMYNEQHQYKKARSEAQASIVNAQAAERYASGAVSRRAKPLQKEK